MASLDDEEQRLRSVALQNATTILRARQQAEAELLRTKEALRESQERLTAALTAAGTGTFRWTLRTDTVEWDGNLDRLFGLASDRTTQSFDALVAAVHPEDRAAVISGADGCAREGADFDVEFRIVQPDGSIRWIDQKAKAFVDAEGKVLYVTGACADVTRRKQAEDALRESEQQLRAIFSQAAVGIAVATLDGRFAEMNQKFVEILGYGADELRGLTFSSITHPDDIAETMAAVSQLLSGTIADYSLEKRYIRKGGGVVWSRTTVTLVRDRTGRPTRFVGVIEDITSRKRGEEALREERRMLEILNESGQALASTLDLQAVVQAVTDAATELSGAEFGAFFYNVTNEAGDAYLLYTLSGAPREAFETFGMPRATALFGPTFRGEAPIRIDDVRADSRYGRMGPHFGMPKGHLPVRSYLAVPVKSRGGDVIGGLFFGHSRTGMFTERSERLITGIAAQAGVAIDNARLYEASQKAGEERKVLLERERAARAEAERMSDVKDDFLATLSHELRTPLNAILGWAQVLRNSSRDETDYQKGLETIERNARAQTQLIEDLLDMSRITSGKLRLDVQPIQPVSFIEAAVETLKPAADARGIRLERSLDPSAGPISGDPDRLQQVVWNLLSNAIKFTPRDGHVQIVLERTDGHLVIRVTDTGVGISPDVLPQLFERFRQADASTTRRYGGLGLGLSIVKNLVELHGGTVAVASPGEGLGTTVTVQLPVALVYREEDVIDRQPPAPAYGTAAEFIPAELAGLKVLVVDDQPDARELITRVLSDCSAEVITAVSAEEALGLLGSERPDVLVSDIGMPDVDGFELLRRIRMLEPEQGGRIPAVALTAFARSEDRIRALRAGFLVHVSKPVDPSELVATVASVARRGEDPNA